MAPSPTTIAANLSEALKQAFGTTPENMAVAADHVAELAAGAKDVGSLTALLNEGLTSTDANHRQSACVVVKTIAEKKVARLEPYVTPVLGHVLDLYTDKKMQVRGPAAEAAKAIVHATNRNAIRVLLPQIFGGMDRTKKWQTKAGALDLINELAELHPVQIDAEESVDAFGNKVVTKVKRKLTRKELKAKLKAKKDAEKRGEHFSDSDLDGLED
ncbi:hypothetical protein SDRG_15775 [Saprolegnia diclina VS20]|uniref:TOG domain-containing protein n=1 Tax=Saprolegnia diclina (strain VS20) TaxID=1156394 RepID=T0PZC3_SAPDV|nr:hypothetical protein SDRG_15775 [Saprolegnia diclina VS20]EQC26430.1 hypothetical protein SDRG_15775 [Saprolegnia diclina VS20]|eukprot:XP_008620179.1 hypothetical protein SDRG_15775 [Saprolegnia diclina VS20]